MVTQARLRSGALNTVNWGNELQRDIHAVPGNIDMPGNSGCNRLIQEQRATIVCSVADMDDVWHAPHPPESFHDVATQRTAMSGRLVMPAYCATAAHRAATGHRR